MTVLIVHTFRCDVIFGPTIRELSCQWLGQQPQPAWDLWALAVVAYGMLTGTHPLGDKSPAEWRGIGPAACFTPVTAHMPQAPQAWQDLFERTFANDPTRRPQSAEALFCESQSALS